MIEQYFLYVCLAAFVAQTAGRAAVVAGAGWYDARQGRQKATKPKRPKPPQSGILLAPSLFVLIRQFELLVHNQFAKAESIVGTRRVAVYRPESAFRIRIRKDQTITWKYKSSSKDETKDMPSGKVLYDSGPVQKYQWNGHEARNLKLVYGALEWGSRAIHAIEPLMITYFFYLAYTFRTGTLLVLHASVFCVWIIFALWSADHLNLRIKAGLLLFLPAVYVLFYVKAVVSLLVSLGKFIVNPLPK